MKTTFNQEIFSFVSTELLIVLTFFVFALLVITIAYYRCRMRKAHKVIIRLLREKSAYEPVGHRLLSALAIVLLLATACVNKVPGTEEMPPIATEPNSSLSIITRAGEEGAIISYPIQCYVFQAETGKCVEKKTMTEGSTELLFKLPADSYTVLALAGASDTDYNLPTVADACITSPITLKAGKSHGDLMTCKVAVTLSENMENNLTITLKRSVMKLSGATITNLPANITAVSLSICPVHESILLDGSYPTASTAIATHAINLVKSTGTPTTSGTSTWTMTDENYFLPTPDNATITISTTATDGTILTLLSPKEAPIVNPADATQLADAIADAIAASTPASTPAAAIAGWRLPTEAEARTLSARYAANSATLNTALTTLGGHVLASGRYYGYTTATGAIKPFVASGASFPADAFTTPQAVRTVATLALAARESAALLITI